MWSTSPREIAVLMLMLLLLLVGGLATVATTTQFLEADQDVVVDANRRLYVAYIVEEDDIMVKKACQCRQRRHCVHTDIVQLTE